MAREVWRVLWAAAAGVLMSQLVAFAWYARAVSTYLGDVPLPARALALPGFLRGVWPRPDEGSVQAGLGAGRSSTTLRCPTSAPPDFRNDPPKYGLYTDSYGWPLRSLVMYRACVFMNSGNGGSVDMPGVFHDFDRRAGLAGGVEGWAWLPRNSARGPMIPVWPLWEGLAVNTAAYGVVVWGLLFVPGVMRRQARRRGRRCMVCGYELAGLARCPECGREVDTVR